jgi:hypothetical protein
MQLPRIFIQLAPRRDGGTLKAMDVSCRLIGFTVPEGGALCAVQESTVGIPFCPVEGGFRFWDDLGEILAERLPDPPRASFVVTSSFHAVRATAGDLCYSYRILPRELPEGYTSSPYFDFRAEPGGGNGAGLTFLALPASDMDAKVETSIKWDLSGMPVSSRGVWSLGAGDVTRVTTVQDLLFSYYAAGELNAEEEGDFGLYWFGGAPFDMAEVARRTKALFAYMSGFFGDREACYRVFARRDPFEKSGGGTAAARSFMFGYSEKTYPSVDAMLNLLAHEMVHNWPHMDDEPAGLTTWYNEGSAEFYSVALPWRAGLTGPGDALKQLNDRAGKYYGNPMRALSNEALAKLYWQDRRTQRVPYGRGFFYLANVDAAIRRSSGGARSLDDAVLEILKRRGAGEKPTPEDWISIVSGLLGYDARPAYDAMAAGEVIAPDTEIFGGAFEAEKTRILLADTGEEADGYQFSLAE